jgi:hypothetical protein
MVIKGIEKVPSSVVAAHELKAVMNRVFTSLEMEVVRTDMDAQRVGSAAIDVSGTIEVMYW